MTFKLKIVPLLIASVFFQQCAFGQQSTGGLPDKRPAEKFVDSVTHKASSCMNGSQISGGTELEKRLVRIASDAIDRRVFKGATPRVRVMICDCGGIWEVEYVPRYDSFPLVRRVTIDKATMEVVQIFFSQ